MTHMALTCKEGLFGFYEGGGYRRVREANDTDHEGNDLTWMVKVL